LVLIHGTSLKVLTEGIQQSAIPAMAATKSIWVIEHQRGDGQIHRLSGVLLSFLLESAGVVAPHAVAGRWWRPVRTREQLSAVVEGLSGVRLLR